jgi:hypothetical protein
MSAYFFDDKSGFCGPVVDDADVMHGLQRLLVGKTLEFLPTTDQSHRETYRVCLILDATTRKIRTATQDFHISAKLHILLS